MALKFILKAVKQNLLRKRNPFKNVEDKPEKGSQNKRKDV